MPLRIPNPVGGVTPINFAGIKDRANRSYLTELSIKRAETGIKRGKEDYAYKKKQRKRQDKLNLHQDRQTEIKDVHQKVSILRSFLIKGQNAYNQSINAGKTEEESRLAGKQAVDTVSAPYKTMFPDMTGNLDSFNPDEVSQTIDTLTTQAQKASQYATQLKNAQTQAKTRKLNSEANGGMTPEEKRKNQRANQKEARSIASKIIEDDPRISWKDALATAKTRVGIDNATNPNPPKHNFSKTEMEQERQLRQQQQKARIGQSMPKLNDQGISGVDANGNAIPMEQTPAQQPPTQPIPTQPVPTDPTNMSLAERSAYFKNQRESKVPLNQLKNWGRGALKNFKSGTNKGYNALIQATSGRQL